MLDEVTAIVDGHNAYFSFSKVKTGYSGETNFQVPLGEGYSGVYTDGEVQMKLTS